MRTTRRALLCGVAAAALLAGCSPNGTAAQIEAQVLADATGAVNGLASVVPAVLKAAPNLLPAATGSQVMQGLTLAQQMLGKMDASTPLPTAANTLQVVEGAILQAVNALAAVTPAAAAAFPVLAPYVVIIQAAAALLPGIVAFINSVIPSGQTASLAAGLPAPVMTPAQARAALGIPSV